MRPMRIFMLARLFAALLALLILFIAAPAQATVPTGKDYAEPAELRSTGPMMVTLRGPAASHEIGRSSHVTQGAPVNVPLEDFETGLGAWTLEGSPTWA